MHLFSIIKTFAAKVLVTLGIISTATTASFGAYNPTAGGTYRLQSSIGTTDTTIVLSSFTEPVSNIKYTMSYLNSSIEYGTIEPTNNSNKEFISFTGITQNSDGTASLTGVTRGLAFSYPYTASTTLRLTHAGQSIFILSNPPQLTNQYANRYNNDAIYGGWLFSSTTHPAYDVNPSSFSGNDLVSYQTLLNTAISGAATSSYSNMGISQLATIAQIGASTASSTEGRPLVLTSELSTTTCQTASSRTLVSSSTSGKLGGNCLDVTYAYNFTGTETFGNTVTTNATTTSLAVTSGNISANGLNYRLPASQSYGVGKNDGSGNITWGGSPRYTYFSINGPSVTGASFATSSDIVIPSGVLSASSTISIMTSANRCVNASVCTYYLRTNTGATLTSCSVTVGGATTYDKGFALIKVLMNNSASSQESMINEYENGGANADLSCGSINSSSIAMGSGVTLNLVVGNDTGGATTAIGSYVVEVNP